MACSQADLHSVDEAACSTWQARLLVVFAVGMAWLLVRALFFEGFHGSDDFAHLRHEIGAHLQDCRFLGGEAHIQEHVA